MKRNHQYVWSVLLLDTKKTGTKNVNYLQMVVGIRSLKQQQQKLFLLINSVHLNTVIMIGEI